MKMVNKLIYIFVMILAGSLSYTQIVIEPYEVATWPGFRSAAVSHTFDDNDLNQLAVVVPMFNEFDFKLTLFTLTGTGTGWRDPNWSGLQQAALQGHEIASHTVTHPYLNQITIDSQKVELENSYNEIMNNIPGMVGLTIAYPYCVKGNDSLTAEYYIGGRGCQGVIEPSTPNDLMNISSIICGTEGSVKKAADFNSRAKSAVNINGLCVFLMHGIDGDGGWSQTQSSELRSHLEYLKANDHKFWVSTFGDIVRYIRERNAVLISETSVQDDSIALQVTDALEDSIYNLPLTIRRPLPDGWRAVCILQNGHYINVQYEKIDLTIYFIFEVIPDRGEIVLKKEASASGIQISEQTIPDSPVLSQNYPNPFNPETEIAFQLPKESNVLLKVMNSLGQEIVTLTNKCFKAGYYIVYWDGKDNNGKPVSSGMYFYQFITDDFINIKKMLLIR